MGKYLFGDHMSVFDVIAVSQVSLYWGRGEITWVQGIIILICMAALSGVARAIFTRSS